jgi:HSP20 family molecular chaperone IbpA
MEEKYDFYKELLKIMGTPSFISTPTCEEYWDTANKIYSFKEEKDKFILKVPYPGFTKEDIKITVKKDILSVLPKKSNEFVAEDTRNIFLPKDGNTRELKAEMLDGLLTITIWKLPIAIETDVDVR